MSTVTTAAKQLAAILEESNGLFEAWEQAEMHLWALQSNDADAQAIAKAKAECRRLYVRREALYPQVVVAQTRFYRASKGLDLI